METIDPRVVELALSNTNGLDFEKFVQGFFSATMGVDYIPMGGHHDGGADGILVNSEGRTFIQASTNANTKLKITDTVSMLRGVGRDPKKLIYATNQKLRLIDKMEEELKAKTECDISIRDGNYFQYQVNDSPGTIQAYKSYLAPAISYLDEIGGASTFQQTDIPPQYGLPAKALCVFLSQELDRSRGKSELTDSVVDSLILWSLEETDPDLGKFLSLGEIEERIIEALPSAKIFLKDMLENRMNELTSKGSGGRKVRFHKKEDGYCLPYETRILIRKENEND